ncbi:Uma2 family endonuclease [Pendulispora albinea]|uniref:Uma2 family endonuclease n=1 Tax=Pendulispora albinea TaxID=2741071 RepID=A0ABZ2LUL5_9BACT
MANAVKRGLCTWEDLAAIPQDQRYHEIIDGEIVRKAQASYEHGDAQSWLVATLKPPFARRPGGPGPGGWWIATEVDVELELHQVYRPDVVGWRRERVPERPTGVPIRIRPDWVCEVLSPNNTRNDTVRKMRGYYRAAIPHYWLVDPMAETLTVYRWNAEAYMLVLTAERGERVRAEPFDAIELDVGLLFGDDPKD